MKKILIASALLTGCAVSAPLYPEGATLTVAHEGLAAPDDGIITVDYAFHSFVTGVLNLETADEKAQSQCSAWGYVEALRLGDEQTQCYERAVYGCVGGVITVTYQCA